MPSRRTARSAPPKPTPRPAQPRWLEAVAGRARSHLFVDFLLAGARRLRHVAALGGRPVHCAAPPPRSVLHHGYGYSGVCGGADPAAFQPHARMRNGADLLPGTVADGFSGLVLFPTCLLTFFLRDDWLAWRRSGGFHRGLAASLNRADAGRFVCGGPRRSRLRFVMVTLTVAAFETRRGLWLLPPGLVWANGHGGYVMGWANCGRLPGARRPNF